ncbi:MAG: spore germination protein [Clostridia bacterium]|nr:spore germination protein [Clostridia bacterium]
MWPGASPQTTPAHRGRAPEESPLVRRVLRLRRRVTRLRERMRGLDGAEPTSRSRAIPARLRWLRDALASDDLACDSIEARSPSEPRGGGGAGRAAQARRVLFDVVYLRSMVDRRQLLEEVLKPLQKQARKAQPAPRPRLDPRLVLPHARPVRGRRAIALGLVRGQAAVLPRRPPGAHADVPGFLVRVDRREGRSVAESSTEPELVASKDAFVEDLRVNLNLLRFRLMTPDLAVRLYRVGRLAPKRVAFLYLRGVAQEELVRAVDGRLRRMPDFDYVASGAELQALAFGATLSPFPVSQETERPETVVRALAAGRVALLVDGSPFALLYPTTMVELDKRNESGFLNPPIAMFIRWLRYLGLFVAVSAPALYVTVMAVSPQLLPPDLLVAISATREGVPYPVILEALLMLVTLDVVTEAALHAPASIGQTLTIVGSLIVGQAAVQAKLASSMMIIVLAVTSIGTLLAANLPLSYAFRIAKYPIVAATSAFGIYGFALAFVALSVHLVSLRSMHVPYMAPMGPVELRGVLTQGPVVLPADMRRLRPDTFRPADETRGRAGLVGQVGSPDPSGEEGR